MNNGNEYYNAGYLKKAESLRTRAIVMAILQVVIMAAVFIFSGTSLWTAFVVLALFRIAKKYAVSNMNKEFYVSDYDEDGNVLDSYWTKGTFLGGLLKIAVIFFIVFGIGDHVVKTYFPENTLGFTIAFYIVAAWIAIEPLIFDICDISLANKIIRAIYSPEDDLDIAAFYSEEEERSEALRGALRIFAVVAVIIAVVAQIVVLNVGARMREKELDMFSAYEEYYEKDPVEPKLSEEWFEEAYGEEGYVSFKKFGTMCEAYLTSEIEVNGQLTNSSISVFFSYNDGEWEATEVSVTCNEVLSVNTSGTWFGKGRDYHMLNGSEENEITIKLEVLNDTEARGSISCVFRGELGYERGFTAVTSKENGLIIVNAELDSKISSLYHEISFAYDPINETIVNLSNAAGMVLEKIN